MVASLQDLSGDSWIHKNILSELERGIEQRLRWIQLRNGLELPLVGTNPNVVWLQQGMLKELNESLWDIGGTEFFLSVLDDELAILVADPQLKTHIVHRNYKDRVLVSALSNREFNDRIITPWLQRVGQRLQDHQPLEGGWDTFLTKSMAWGADKSPETAFFRLRNLTRTNSPEEFSRVAVSNRAVLVHELRDQPGGWVKFLNALRSARGSKEAIEVYAKENGLTALIPRLLDYQDHVFMPDLLPVGDAGGEGELKALEAALVAIRSPQVVPDAVLENVAPLLRGNWIFDRSIFLRNTLQRGQFIIAGDVRGLGLKALMARDEWIAQGARFDQITRIYDGTTAELNELIKDIVGDLRKVLGPGQSVVGIYATGDDLMISISGAAGRADLEKVLESKTQIYFHVSEIERPGVAESIADAVADARDQLFEKKKRKPASVENSRITWRLKKNSVLLPKPKKTRVRIPENAAPKQAPY
jgi:hypothetical protein